MTELIKNEAGFVQTKIEIAKRNTETNTNEKVGEVIIHVPLLEAFGISAEIEKVQEDGLPSYKDDKHDFLFGSVVAAIKAKARNALVSGTADLKPGLSIATNFDELFADGGRQSGAEALAIVRDIKAKMAFWLASVEKKSKGTQDFINGLFASRQALSLQSEVNRTKMAEYIERFSEWLASEDVELLEKASRYINSLLEAAKVSASTEDF